MVILHAIVQFCIRIFIKIKINLIYFKCIIVFMSRFSSRLNKHFIERTEVIAILRVIFDFIYIYRFIDSIVAVMSYRDA
jgi:hypothetical protein